MLAAERGLLWVFERGAPFCSLAFGGGFSYHMPMRFGSWHAQLVGSIAFIGLASSLALSATGCDSPCEKGGEDETLVEVRDVQPVDGRYASSGWNEPFFPFPPGKRYVFHHGLQREPSMLTVYVAFTENPVPSSNASVAAGDEAVIEVVDDEKIQVRNNTCNEFWVRVAAE